jgi:hypothetical protein
VWRLKGISETNVSSYVASLGFNREDTVCLALLISIDYNLYNGVPYRLRTTVIEKNGVIIDTQQKKFC